MPFKDVDTDEEMLHHFSEDTDGTHLKHDTIMGRRSMSPFPPSPSLLRQDADPSLSDPLLDWTMTDYLPETGELRFDIRVEIKQGDGETKGCVSDLIPSSDLR